ncbi:protein mono-ADP-ribosyltransferase PARP10 [Pseudophryne corroboree]|uniref:protein mono-ADP-ribosyltransferase PARP10 n=1 Tax=Pseudophryne corroboree TaxID=495146 RepID=UPI0030816584
MEVEVRGLSDSVDTEFLVLYLESKRHSGGGTVHSCTRNGSVALVTFVNACDAENVLAKEEHIVKNVEVHVYRLPPWDPGKVALCCLDPDTEDSLLELYVENVSDREEFTTRRSQDRCTVLIAFPDPLSDEEFEHLAQCVKARKLHQASVSLQRVRACAEVLVENVGSHVSAELLEMYFESRRSGGGRVKSLTLLRNNSAAVVSFCDYKVAAQVVSRSHCLEKCELVVSPFYPDLLGFANREEGGPPEEEGREADGIENTEEEREADGIENTEENRKDLQRSPVYKNEEQEENMRVQPGIEFELQEGKQRDFQEGVQAEMSEHLEGYESGHQTGSEIAGLSSGDTQGYSEVESSIVSMPEVDVLMEAAELRFIQEYHHDLLAGMDQVTIVPLDVEEKFGFNVRGDAVSCKTAVELLQHIVSSLSSRTVTLEYPGVSLFLLDEEGQRALSETERLHHCVIDMSQLSWKLLNCKYTDPWSFVYDVLGADMSPVQTTVSEKVSEPEDLLLAADMEGIKKIASLLRDVEGEGDRHKRILSEESPETTTDYNIRPEDAEEDLYADTSPEVIEEAVSELMDEELDQACKISRDEYQERELDEEAQLLLAIQRSMDKQEISMDEEDEELQRVLQLSLKQQVLEETEESLQRALEMSFCDKGAYGQRKTFPGIEEVQPFSCNEMEGASDAAHIKVLAGDETSLVVACTALRKTVTAKLCTVTLDGIRTFPHKAEILSALERKHSVRITVSEGQAHIQGFLQCPTRCRQELSQILSALQEGLEPQVELMSLEVQQKVAMIPVSESSEEYDRVVQPFLSTLQKQKPVTKVLQVQRVHNTLLYNQYQLKKQSMLVHDPNTPIEHILYHGTTATGAREICHHGFNRSFCGKNATLYGQGVYFAVEAAISTLDIYSPPSGEGKKFVLVAQVLTGEFVQGKPDMRTPPIVPNSDADVPRRYDSLVNRLQKPSIFVIFNDTQAYPQYLITCCKSDSSV